MRDYVDAALGPRRFNLGLFGAFSISGVVLAVLGVYGLVSYVVSQRRREIGLRMAVGATEGDIHRLILGQAALPGLAGVAVGIGCAWMAKPLLSSVARDVAMGVRPAILAAGALFVLVILTAWMPARRAARISPTSALRGE